jgi:signal transduction histidine kinase
MTATPNTQNVNANPLGSGASAPGLLTANRLGLALAGLAAAAAVVAAVLYLSFALAWRGETFFGALLNRSLMVDGSRSVTETPWQGLAAGLRRGDQIVAIHEQSLAPSIIDYDAARENFRRVMATLTPGDNIQVNFLRPLSGEACGARSSSAYLCSITYAVGQFPNNDFLAFFLVPFGSGFIVLVIGLALLALRPNQYLARMVAVTLLLLSIFLTGMFDVNTSFRLNSLWIVATALLAGQLISLALVFPTKTTLAYAQPYLAYVPLGVSLLLGAALLVGMNSLWSAEAGSTLPLLASFLALASLVVFTAGLWRRRRHSASRTNRDQINTVLIGVMVTFIVGALWLLNVLARTLTGVEPLPLNTSAAMPFIVVPAFSLAYTVLQRRSFDTDRVISQTITYTLMLAGLVFGYFLIVFSASLITGDAVRANDPILIAVVIFLMAVLFVPVRTRIQEHIDRLYFRTRVGYQYQVESFARELTSAADFDTILQSYLERLQDALQPERIFVFLPSAQTGDYAAYAVADGRPATDVRFASSSPLMDVLRGSEPLVYLEPGRPWDDALIAERTRLQILGTLVIAGFRGASQLNGFVLVGAPRSGANRYSYEALRFIESMTAQISVAVERAQVVESLERRVRELDVLSQVSQAVNFAVEFDDLLELISTQADKLISATHFYIVLRDPAQHELYYAFFLEGEDRARANENRRWSMSNDLYSEVIRTGQPMRTRHYAQALSERGAEIRCEDPNLRAWMGVPMLAGTQVLGVLAAGTTQPGRTYTDEQFKIFNDIGALAATSIDKARLFAETNIRARQLAALNDISRQLVAAEANLEGLLKLITASAADILEAEAGSLLLTPDDNSSDLEFRVVIGGSGQELIGRRLPAGRGLVGEVASTGQIVIVNDVANDPRWAGELSKGTFRTTSVIAVPLITQDRVIGVLELLNKQNNGVFSNDDAALLSTFAGQAAVAIENARLFQMTDLQLSQRVGELETLERIDVELNRSLDLSKVAQITVEWAMENSRATAGLLGVVVGDPPRLDIVYKVGYGEEDLPEDSEGNLWSLGRGIVSRVMRTKQAELVPDVTIDPNYVPSLRASLSQITIPMLSGGQINALLVLETDREPRLRIADMPFLQRLAEHASIAIANAQLYAELTRANLSKSEFVSFVAHELKNPLTSIQGYSDVLLGGAVGGLSDQQKNFLGTIRFNADRMNTLVSDLNDVTKLQTNNLRLMRAHIDFRQAVTETLRPLQKQIDDKQQRLILDIPDDLPPVYADQNRLIQVLTNLVSNAHKYSPAGGSIMISAYVNENLHDSRGRTLPSALVATVRDTGIGLSEEDRARLFTPYFRSDNPAAREQPGTGLGLTITRGIIERHEGLIWVESELGTGTAFHFTIPLESETEHEPQ